MKKIYFFILLSFILNNIYCQLIESNLDNNKVTDSKNAYIHSTSLPVGTISGGASVSPSGAANYQIPIFVSPGTAGMVPELSIVYNSQSGDGLLGKGWHLAGLSQIKLDNNISYLDGFNESVKFDVNNTGKIIRYEKRFALDGQRLFCVNGSYAVANSEYRTEIESFKKIEYKNNSFIATDKNGIKSYYGQTTDSKATLGSVSNPLQIIMWNINKVEDPNGNYMTFEYYNESEFPNNERPIKRIRYTGNTAANVLPYNEIYFVYGTRGDSYKKSFGNIIFDNRSLLTEIHIKSEGNIVKKYIFNYSTNPYTRLVEIIEKDASGSRLNSTVVQWGTKNYALNRPSNDAVLEITTDIISNLDNFRSELITPLTGDFNGDGIHDFAIYYKQNPSYVSNYSILQTFLGKSNGGFTSTSRYRKERNYNIYTADVNYDGKDEFVLTSGQSLVGTPKSCYYSLSNSNTYSETALDSTEFRIVPGNFYGNGKSSYIIYNDFLPTSKWNIWHFNDNNQIRHDLVQSNITSFTSDMYRNALNHHIDFDGDGTTDILAIRNNSLTMNEFNTINGTLYFDSYLFNTNNYITTTQFNASDFNDIFKFADFNGDGKTDLLKKVGTTLKMYPSTGLEFSSSNGFTFNSSFSNSTYKFYAIDMNGDGIADIVELGFHDGKYKIIINLSKGSGTFESITYISPSNIEISTIVGLIFGDYNGDGKTDIIYYDSNRKYRVLYFMQNDQSDLVTKITNGMNFKNEFTYKRANSLLKLSGPTKDIRPFSSSTPIVSTVNESTGTTDPMKTINYTFNYGRVHVKGKGFIGFETVKSVDNTNNLTISTFSQFDDTRNMIKSSTVTKSTNYGDLISSEQTDYLIKTMSNNNHLAVLPKRVKFRDYLLHSENLTETEYNYHNEATGVFYGNIKYILTDYSGLYTITSSTFNYYSAGTWYASRPASIGEERRQNGQIIEKETQFDYDSKGNIATTYSYAVQDYDRERNDLETIYTYDNFGNILTKTIKGRSRESSAIYDQERKTIYQYDTKGRFIIKETDPEGLFTEKTYNSNFGTIATHKDFRGKITTYEYDGFGNLKKIVYPTGQISNITRNWAINDNSGIPSGINTRSVYYIESITTGKPTEKIWYDLLGREVRVRTDLYNKQTNVVTEYNKNGTINRTTLPFFNGAGTASWQTYTYDAFRRQLTFNSQNLQTRYAYLYGQNKIFYPDGNVEVINIDKAGQTTSISSNNGQVSYEYNGHGKPKKITAENSEITMEYDSYGNQTKLSDKNSGVFTYLYNSFGELIKQVDANGNTISMEYNTAGKLRVKYFLYSTYNVWYEYYTDNSGSGAYKGLIKKENMGNGNIKEYEYDSYGNITKMIETISGSVYTHTYTYDQYNNLETYTYPSGFTVRNEYNTKGFLTGVYNGSSQIWKLSGTDYITEMGQIKNYYMGPNNISATHSYNSYFELTNISATYQSLSLANYKYTFDHAKGNLNDRRDITRNMNENFTYDNNHRLTDWWRTGYSKDTVRYNSSGNITSKSGAGTYSYNSNKPHAVEKINISYLTTKIKLIQQNITYTPFLKTATVNEGSYSYTITYGPDQQRKITKLFFSGELQKTKIYSGLYEKETVGANTKEIHYIATGSGKTAVNIKYDGQRDTTYYIIRDHLGSIMKIVRPNGTIAEENSYDPWGNLRNPSDWVYENTNRNLLLGRGYTGHEHLPEFKLINMNGRMYDPMIARVLSPDNFVQDPNNAQNYNRYTYCLNNPLRYSDPSGMLYDIVIKGVNNSSLILKTDLVDYTFNTDIDFLGNHEIADLSRIAIGYQGGVSATGAAGVGTSYNAFAMKTLFLGGDYAGYWYNYGGVEGQLVAKMAAEATISGELSWFLAINDEEKTYTPEKFSGLYYGGGVNGVLEVGGVGVNVGGKFSISEDNTWKVFSIGGSIGVGPQIGLGLGAEAHMGTTYLMTEQKRTSERSWFDIGANWYINMPFKSLFLPF